MILLCLLFVKNIVWKSWQNFGSRYLQIHAEYSVVHNISEMLPSMPVLFTRDSQDAFGSKIQPSTSFPSRHSFIKPAISINPEPAPFVAAPEPPKVTKETKGKGNAKKKDQGKENPPKINSALETALVRSYYTKVQSRFSSYANLPTNKFGQFQSILKSFDPSKETPVDLYRKIEQLFGEQHKDIVEEFLLFLRPGQAAQIGRFMDHFMLVQLTGFIEMLQSAFARKPTVLRKVLRALTAGISSGSSEEMRARVLPHLRSSPRLALTFRSLFPDERPPDSLYETSTDVVNENFLTGDKGFDVWEIDEVSDNKKKLEAKESLDTMYLHGRVFIQHGRMLRSARVTYPYSKEPYRVHARRLAPNLCHLSPPESEEERSPKRQNKSTSKIPPKKAKKQLKSPTKNVKDVNDNTNKDCVTNSPKAVRKQSNAKTKNFKDKKDDTTPKRDKKDKIDNKNHVACKKDDSTKVKQAKADTPTIKVKKPDVKGNWTRDEDKTMLQVLKGEAGSEQIFGRIRQVLPHRSVSEIKERFFHVMNLLQQMAVGEVT